MDKKKYVLHISALKFYLQHGLSLRKVHRCRSNVVVMRSKPGASLLDALVQVANRTLKKMTNQAKFKPFIPALSAIFSAAVVAFQGLGPAAAPISNSVRDAFSMAAGEREKALDEFLQMVRKASQQPAIVVDEANLALPGLTNGQDSRERLEAKSALAAITKWTKQDMLSSVVLISSEFGYPPSACKLQG
jgi:hypothetical protein